MRLLILPTNSLPPGGQNDWRTDTRENITFPQLRLWAVTRKVSNRYGFNSSTTSSFAFQFNRLKKMGDWEVFTPCRSLSCSGGGATASFALTMGMIFNLRSSFNVDRRFMRLLSLWKSGLVTRIYNIRKKTKYYWIFLWLEFHCVIYRHL